MIILRGSSLSISLPVMADTSTMSAELRKVMQKPLVKVGYSRFVGVVFGAVVLTQ